MMVAIGTAAYQKRKHPGLFALGKPVGQVQSDSWEIACLRQPQKKPDDIEKPNSFFLCCNVSRQQIGERATEKMRTSEQRTCH
jgi:hypothetical protein